ncbi:D-2-hydroxyacid dehydrogenase [Xylophilus sp. Kf1]|nr:D-2-hydroxyacid dehydrogenase [Xylophilus sp. Kf1]
MTAGAAPLRILLSAQAEARHADAIARCLQGRDFKLVRQGDAEVAFVSRDVTGLSTKHQLQPDTRAFYDLLLAAASLRWVHTHAAGSDRPIFRQLTDRGVRVTTSTGANAVVVAQTALAALLGLARRLPQLASAQREHRWASLIAGALPRDLAGQRVTIVGWGPIAREAARLLVAVGLQVAVVRSSDTPVAEGFTTVAFEDLGQLLPATDWLLLACPLSERTQGLVDARALAHLPPGAHLLNVSRGEVVDEPALVAALTGGHLAGAYLDVFAFEPLPADSPLWDLPNVIVTPHSAGFSDGNASRVFDIFLAHLKEYAGQRAGR